MASSGKKKTTMAKLNRERKLRERRLDKQARKDARKMAAAGHEQAGDAFTGGDESAPSGTREPALETIGESLRLPGHRAGAAAVPEHVNASREVPLLE
jgi:hypothetical protein